MKKNIVLLGGSNSVMINGLQRGLRKYSKEVNRDFYNFSLGACTAVQNFYELHRKKNLDVLENAELIITESNVNEIYQNYEEHEKLPLNVINDNLFLLYRKLASYQSKILVLILPYLLGNFKIINDMHKFWIRYFKLNYIDVHEYYEKNNLHEFGKRIDMAHQLPRVMYELGKNIIKNIDQMKNNNKESNIEDNLIIVNMGDMETFKKVNPRNSLYNEIAYRLDNKKVFIFPKKYSGYKILAVHTWNYNKCFCRDENLINYSKIIFKNKTKTLSKDINFLNLVCEFHHDFFIDDNTTVFVSKMIADIEEHHQAVRFWNKKSKWHEYVDVVSFILIKNHNTNLSFFEQSNIGTIGYDFNHIIPDILTYKEIIDEYCQMMDPIKSQSLQNQVNILNSRIILLEQNKIKLSQEKDKIQQDNTSLIQALNSLPIKKQQLEISNLEQDLINKKLQTKQLSKKFGIKMNDFMPKITIINPSSAKARIQNQLSYKLGQAMIVNSKSFLGYIRMPFVLSYIKDKHKQEQKNYQEKIKKDPSLKLPPLESYPDYQEALKEKECFTYKLGEALIRANNNWYGGVYQTVV